MSISHSASEVLLLHKIHLFGLLTGKPRGIGFCASGQHERGRKNKNTGIVGAFFVKCTHEVYQFRKRRLTYLSNRFVLVGVVALVSGLAQYNNELLRIDPRKAINELFSSNAMQLMTYSDVMFLLLIKFPLIAVCVGLPIPGGVFISC